MATPLRIELTGPELAGSYVVAEKRADGTLVLRPDGVERERLSEVIEQTEGRVFRDEEFVAHLDRVAAADDDLPSDDAA